MKKTILVLILFTISIMFIGCSNKITIGNQDAFAQCLTEKGVTMYGTEWCPHCQNQKEEFGDSFQYINFVDCDLSKGACKEAGIEGYPTWRIEGENYPGEQNLYKLASLSGCIIEE